MTTLMDLRLAGAALVLAASLAACGTADGGAMAGGEPTGGRVDPEAAACPVGEPDCVDTPQLQDDTPVTIDETGIEQLRRDAQFYLGLEQDELNELVRIARIDGEHRPVTDDYQVGRITVELDDLEGDGTPVVTSSTVELPGGPETFHLEG